ncbi:sugar ABC transporter substrate-binding protein [Candidatus Bipolaricaulota bacterium]|nr:sugar ABC transporter substrate-binding protein [Candidatus Bipolaricaulota bacterium]
MSRNKLRALSGVLAIVLFLSAFIATGPQAVSAEKNYKFIAVTHSATISFWNPMKRGLKDAAKQLEASHEGLEISVEHLGPQLFDVSKQREILVNAIASEPDGLIVSLPDSTAFDKPVQDALDKGIPVVAMNTDDPGENPRMAFVGQDLVASGRQLGEQIVRLVGESGKVAIGTSAPGHTALEARLKGAKQVLDKAGVKYKILDTTADLTKAVSTFQSYLTSNPDADGIFAVDGTGTDAVGNVVRTMGLKGQVHGGGFDLVVGTLEDIKNGFTDFTLDQHPYLQGYYPVLELFNYLEYGIQPSDIDTGAGVINQENVEEVLKLADEGYR